MHLILPLEQMTMSDKLRTMETIWDNLCENSDDLISFPWHGEVLAERDKRLAKGEEEIYDWSDAKKHIRESL